MTERNMVELQNVVRYYQSWNLWSKNWTIPKKHDERDGKWKPISTLNLNAVVTKKDGFAFAIYRMHKIMTNIKDDHFRPVWRVNPISKYNTVWNGKTYVVFRFDCHRIFHGIVGGMNTVGGAGAAK